jgi:hypothetical protein
MRPVLSRLAALLLLLAAIAPREALAFADTEVLQRLNTAGREAYAAGRKELLSRVTPVVIVGSDITILRDGTETNLPYTPPLYDALKSVSHLVLGTVGLLHPHADRPDATEPLWRPHLQAMRGAAAETLPLLEELGFAGDDLLRNRAIIVRMLAFIDDTLASHAFTLQGLTEVAREVAPLLLANAGSAARAQIDMLHAAIQSWRATLAEGEWEKARVFVLGPRMPRAGNLQFAYFRHAMGDEAVDHRLIYAEGIFQQAGALSLLGTVVADRALATLAFGDEMRMDRDFLADAADVHLKHLFGQLGRDKP